MNRTLPSYVGGEPSVTSHLSCSAVCTVRCAPQKPLSASDYSFKVVTRNSALRVDPGSKEAFEKWQEALMSAMSEMSEL